MMTICEFPTETVDVRVIDGEFARQGLLSSKDRDTRSIVDSVVTNMVDDLLDGKWQFNGASSIVFDENGVLINGHHRLTALVRASKVDASVRMKTIVARGTFSETMATIDTGRSRKTSDVLKIAGYKNYAVLAAGARLLWLYDSGRIMKSWWGVTTPHGILHYVQSHPDITLSVQPTAYARQCAIHSQLVFLHYLTKDYEEASISEFIDLLGTGASSDVNHPALRYRNWRITTKTNTRLRFTSQTILALLIKSWNKFALGEPMNAPPRWRRIGERKEGFPGVIY